MNLATSAKPSPGPHVLGALLGRRGHPGDAILGLAEMVLEYAHEAGSLCLHRLDDSGGAS